MEWRKVIHTYLAASDRDSRDWAEKESQSCRFIARSCTTRYRRLREEKAALSAAAHRPPDPPKTYRAVIEEPGLVVAQVRQVENSHPYITTRFRLLREDQNWLIDDIFAACPFCNDVDRPRASLATEPGACFSCQGSGSCSSCEDGLCWACEMSGKVLYDEGWEVCTVCDGAGVCTRCRGTTICRKCGGSGRCQFCKDSEMPGWLGECQPTPSLPEDTEQAAGGHKDALDRAL